MQRKQEKRELTPYQQKLLDPRWQKKRLEILERDEWACRQCGDESTTLHVHHRYYTRDKEPWEYPNEALITLCHTCHEIETNERPYAERHLLDMLRMMGFDHDEVLRIAEAFKYWEMIDCECEHEFLNHKVNIAVLAWAMRNQHIMQMLHDRHGAEMQERLLRG